MSLQLYVLRIVASVVVGTSVLTLIGPLVGEVVATLPPLFLAKARYAPDSLALPYEEVAFPTAEGLILRGWFFPTEQPNAPAVLYAPSTAHDQRSGLSLVTALHHAGYQVLLFSYRGQARSEGNYFGFTYGFAESEDVDAAVRFLYETRGIHRIGAIGHSVGAVSIILSAARNPRLGAVVAASPFNCVDEVWQTSRPSWLPGFVFDFILRLSELRKGFSRSAVCPLKVVSEIAPRPVLIIQGTRDQHITERQMESLFAAAAEPKTLWLIEGATHADVRSPMLDVLMSDVIAFLDDALREELPAPEWAAAAEAGEIASDSAIEAPGIPERALAFGAGQPWQSRVRLRPLVQR